jgi:hypothetical protein
MKLKLCILFLLLALVSPAMAITNVVRFSLVDLHMVNTTNRKCLVGPLDAPLAAGGKLSIRDQVPMTTDANGQFYLSNMIAQTYAIRVMAPPAETTFYIQVTNNTTAVMDAYTLQVAPPTPTSVTYTKQQIDAMFAEIGGGEGGETNTASNSGSGVGVFFEKQGVDLVFKGISGQDGIRVDDVGDLIAIGAQNVNAVSVNYALHAVCQSFMLTMPVGGVDYDGLTRLTQLDPTDGSLNEFTDATVEVGSRILITNGVYLVNAQINGIYVVEGVGDGVSTPFVLARAEDCNELGEIFPGSFVPVVRSEAGYMLFICTRGLDFAGGDDILFAPFGDASMIFGGKFEQALFPDNVPLLDQNQIGGRQWSGINLFGGETFATEIRFGITDTGVRTPSACALILQWLSTTERDNSDFDLGAFILNTNLNRLQLYDANNNWMTVPFLEQSNTYTGSFSGSGTIATTKTITATNGYVMYQTPTGSFPTSSVPISSASTTNLLSLNYKGRPSWVWTNYASANAGSFCNWSNNTAVIFSP